MLYYIILYIYVYMCICLYMYLYMCTVAHACLMHACAGEVVLAGRKACSRQQTKGRRAQADMTGDHLESELTSWILEAVKFTGH